MNEEYLRGFFDAYVKPKKADAVYEDWVSKIRDNDEYKQGMFNTYVKTPDAGQDVNYDDWNTKVFGPKKKVSSVVGPPEQEITSPEDFEQLPQQSIQPQTESSQLTEQPGGEPVDIQGAQIDTRALQGFNLPNQPAYKSPEQIAEEYQIAQKNRLTAENTFGNPEAFTKVVGERIKKVAQERGQTPEQLVKDRKWYQADFLDPKYREEFKSVAYLEDTADRLKNALDNESNPEEQKKIIQQIYENSEKQGIKLDELRKKDEFKPFFTPAAIEQAISDMGGASDPEQTGLEKFNKYYNALHQEYLDLKEGQLVKGVTGEYGTLAKAGSAALAGTFLGGNDGLNRFYEIEGLLKKYAPIALLNRKPEYKDDTFLGSLGKSFVKGFSPAGKQFKTELEFAQRLDHDIKGLGLDKNITDLKGLEKAAKFGEKGYDDYALSDPNYWASMLGMTTGLMGQMFAGIPVVNQGMKATQVGQKIIQLADKGADIRTLVKAKQLAENITKSEKLGRAFSKATNWTLKHGSGAAQSAAQYGGTGIIFPVQADELNYMGGLFGYVGQESVTALLPSAKRFTPLLKKMFGEQGSQRAVNALIRSGQLVGRGIGETGEETGQELASIFRQENTPFFDELDRRYGDMEDVSKFLISTFVMGLAFGLTTKPGQGSAKTFKKGLDDLKKSNPEEAAKVEEVVNGLSNDFEKSVNQTIDDSNGTRKEGEGITEEVVQPVQQNAEQQEGLGSEETIRETTAGGLRTDTEVPAAVLTGQAKVDQALESLKSKIKPQENEEVTVEPVPSGEELENKGSKQDQIEAVLRASDEASERAKIGPRERQSQQEKDLEPLVQPKEELVPQNAKQLPSGQEHDVYYDQEAGTVTKVSNLSKNESWTDYMDRVNLQNELFPDEGYTVKGVIKENGQLKPVVEQPYIPGTKVSDSELADDLGTMGFFPISKGDNIFYNDELGVRLSDLHKGNVVKDEKGNIRYIDPVIDREEPFANEQEKKEYFESKEAFNKPTTENAIQERSPEKTTLDETSGSSKEVESGVSKPKEPPVTQERTGQASDEAKATAKVKIQSLIDSGDIAKADKGYTVLTEKGGRELKAITDELSKKAPPALPKKSDPKTQVVDAIRVAIGTEKLGKREIEKIGEEAGIQDKNEVKELAELAVVQKARELAQKDDFEGLVKLYDNQPNLTHRTNESIEKQQYSTPAPVSYSLGKYVGLDKPGKKFEPSAGNGMLTIVADPKEFTVNEIDNVRRANLETQGFGEVLNQDGSQDFKRAKQYDSVITNPPFGGVEAQSIEGYKLNELAQIMSVRALDAMKDDGKAAIIIGGNNQFDEKGQLKGRDRIYFNYLFNKYNVEDVIDISGDIYRKQGASFPIRAILINGRKATPEGVAPTKEWFGKQETTFEGINERIKSHESLQSTELVGGPTTDTGRRSAGVSQQTEKQPVAPVPPVEVSGTGEKVTAPSKTGVGKPRSGRTEQQPGGDSGRNISEQPLSENVEQQGSAEQSQQQQPEGAEVAPESRPKRDRKVAVRSESGESTVSYQPVSKGKSFNVSTPANLQQEILDAQTNLENEVGDVDAFVQKKLGYKTKEEMYKALGAEQIDGVALAIRNIERGTGIIIGDQPGIGKGRSQPIDSKILTPSGWKLMGEMRVGQSVISADGSETKVIGVYPQGELDVYEIVFSDGSKTQCSEDHLWLSINNDQKSYLKNDPDKYKVYAQWRVKTTGELLKKIKHRFSIPMVSPVDFLKKELPIDPYLLGVLLGDAHLRSHSVELTCADDQILESVRFLINDKLQARFIRKYHYQISRKTKFGSDQSNPLVLALRRLDLTGKTAKNKFIPELYKVNSVESRISILQGLMDTDGYVSAEGSCMYYTVSKQLADDIQFIVQSLGGIVTRSLKKPTYTYKGEKKKGLDCHVVYIKLPNSIIPFRLDRKKNRCVKLTKYTPNRVIKSITKIGRKECQCIKVDHPSSLYVTDDFIVTHNTGAALVRYANQQGKTPIFLTKSAYLFTNFFGDLADIDYGNIKPYIFNSQDANKFPAIFSSEVDEKSGKAKVLWKAPTSGVESRPVPNDAKIIMATYSQFSSERYKSKIDLFRKLAKDNILIMDESHMASGDDSNTSRVFQDILPTTKGVVYLSGTYAKRASNMPVYAMKTSMNEANMSPEELVEAISKGGNPLQEINASILTESGEMIRRERTFKGIEVKTHVIGGEDQSIKDRQIKQADAVTEVMRDIIDFQQVHVGPVIKALDIQQKGGKVSGRKGANLGGVTQSPYFQKVFNVINQLLYSIKSKDVAKLMIEEFKAGRKPFLAVKSTMEAMLNDMVDRGELGMGDPINPDFSFVIKKGLEGVMRITREDAQGNKTYENIPVTELKPQGQLEYKRILSRINNLKTGLTLSPIDQILGDLRAAGLRVAEITGRKIRVDFKGDNAYLEPNKKLSINEAYRQYNNGDIDVLIVNRSGSTGASAHASEKVKDQRPRTMFVLEHELDISELVQILFRINRSGQVNLPKYVFVSSTIPAEQRLMMMTTRKLKSLDANTTSNQKQSKGLIEVPEIFNRYGDQVVYEYLQDNPEINNEIGDPVKANINSAGEMVPEDGAANKVTGKVAVLSADKQAAFYQDITNRYNKYIQFLDEAGMNDLVIENLPLKAKTLEKGTTIVGKGGRSRFGDDTFLEEVEVNVLKKPMTKAEIDHQINELGGNRNAEFKDALGKYAESLYSKTEADVNAKFDKKVNAITADEKLTPEVKQAEIKALNEERENFMTGKKSAAEVKIRYMESLLSFFKPERAVMIPVDYNDMRGGGVRAGIFMGFDINVDDPKAFLPSNVTLKFAINDSRRTLTLPASREGIVNFIRDSSYNLSSSFQKNTREDWDNLKKPKDREKRYIVTGNILQGLGKDEYRKGSIVKYTTDEGYVNTGILLPEAFDPKEENVGGNVSVPAKKAIEYVSKMPVTGEVSNSEGDVTIYRKTPNAFRIRVPLAKQTGGKYFLDEGMNKIVINGRWDSVGSSMEAIVDDSRIGELLSYMGNKYSTSLLLDKKNLTPGNLYKPSGKSTTIDEAKLRNRPKKSDVKPFNMADRIKGIFKKYGVPIDEGSLRRKYDGVYKHMTKGVRVQSMWDLFVASHEMTHALDARHNLSETVRKNASQKLQAEFIHAYENLYPTPKKTASLNERIQEGMAMVLEYYLADPQLVEQNYPEIVKHLFTSGGNFFKQEMGDFIKDMDEVVLDYQSLHPEDRINARIKWDGTNKESGVSTQTKVLHALTNDLITANMVDNMMGGELRAKAIIPNVTMLRNIMAIAGNWIKKPFGPTEHPQTLIGDGMWGPKKGKYRVEDLLKELKTMNEIIIFSDYIIARRQYFDYIKLDQLEEEISQGNKDLQEKFDKLSKIVENNKMPRDLVEATYYKFDSKYTKATEMFDSINRDLIDFMEASELITQDRAIEYRTESGYASYQRYVEDEHLSDIDSLNLSSGAKSNLKQLKNRTGSALQILPPVYSQMVAISEVLRRGQLNLVWKAWADAAKANPEVAKMFEPVVLQDTKNPNNFQPVWEKGVQKWYKLSEESRMFAQALSADQVNLLNAFLRGAARTFQASTTQFFAPFAAMNITIDASTRFMQTKTNLIPFIHDVPTIGKAMTGLAHWMGLVDHSANNEFLEYMALGGRKQTLAGTLQLEPQEALESVLNTDWVTKSKSGFEKAIQVIEMPVNMTELVGRATEFKRALAKGYPTNVAMHLAANVGINFSNKGALANNYVKSVAYMGAGIQAFSQFIKTAKENPARTGMAIGIMTTLASTAAIMVYAFGDDDEKIKLANQAPEELARFIFIPNSMFGGKSGLIKIRIPEQGGNIAAAAQLYWQNQFMDAKISFTDVYKTQEALLPSQLRASQGLGLLGSYLPQAISPSIQAVTNTRFYPTMAPIVPDWMQDLDEYAQYDKYTSRAAKAIGELTQDEFVEISPKKVDFFIRAQFGRSASLVQGLAESALFGDPVKTYVNIFEESDRFLFTGKVYNKFYEMRDEANEELRALKAMGNLYPISEEIYSAVSARASVYNDVHKDLTTVGDALNNGIDVSIEIRKQLYDRLLMITKEELFKQP